MSGGYYYSDLPVLALWGSRFTAISKPIDQFLDDASTGNLPNVTYVDPRFVGEGQGITNDDHPLADIRNGQVFINQIYEAVTASPNWPDSVLIFNYDEWGGFFDHVPPPLAPQTDLDPQLGPAVLRPAGSVRDPVHGGSDAGPLRALRPAIPGGALRLPRATALKAHRDLAERQAKQPAIDAAAAVRGHAEDYLRPHGHLPRRSPCRGQCGPEAPAGP